MGNTTVRREGDAGVLLIQVDQASSAAGTHLRRALFAALEDAGMPRRTQTVSVGPERYTEVRSGSLPPDAGRQAFDLTIFALKVYIIAELPKAGDRLVSALRHRITEWRSSTGNEGLEVRIYGPDGEVLAVVTVDRPHDEERA
jgi:hypothetical protein